jgi:caffeoyl-CoA O-methyltransferase
VSWEQLQEYSEALTTPDGDFMAGLARRITDELPYPSMLSGPLVGRLLEMLVFAVQPRLVVEIGTYGGYSALAMAAALPIGGRIITLELDPDHAAFARRAFARAGEERIELIEGPAIDSLERIDGPLDFVFIDAEKSGYRDYYDTVVPKLSPGGLIAIDNTLRSGTVLDPGEDEIARTMVAFNQHVAGDPRTRQVLVPARDGVTVVRRA